MEIKILSTKQAAAHDQLVNHPLQSWAWGKFKQKTGVQTIRVGALENKNLVATYQMTVHTLPLLGWKLGYFPKADVPDETQLQALRYAAKKYKLFSIKLEPNVYAPTDEADKKLEVYRDYLLAHKCKPGKHLFTSYSFIVDLTPSEEELLASFKSKTRYNIKVAQKHGVKVSIDNSNQAFEEYISLWKETTKRQGFYAHDEAYQRNMWKIMHKAGQAHLAKATYQGQVLSMWVIFIFNETLYYPYGASSREHRKVMANNLLAWEVIKFGKKKGCQTFDMWGSLGPDPDKSHSWYGFHRFKEGYGGELMEFLGTYDLVINPVKYHLYLLLDNLRWKVLRWKARVLG